MPTAAASMCSRSSCIGLPLHRVQAMDLRRVRVGLVAVAVVAGAGCPIEADPAPVDEVVRPKGDPKTVGVSSPGGVEWQVLETAGDPAGKCATVALEGAEPQ